MRVGSRFTGEVSGIEFGERGVDIVEIEPDDGSDPPFSVNFGDVEYRFGTQTAVVAQLATN